MGNAMVHSFFKANFKRKASVLDSDIDSESSFETYDLDSYEFDPKRIAQRKKAAKTSKYIYKTLFEESQGSDVTIKALGQSWNLHKLYLSQSNYFHTMFNGDWLETEKKEVEIHIDDRNITPEALHKVFSSFYRDEIEVKPVEAIPVLGAASLFQMDEISALCIQVMKHNVTTETVFIYYECADFYSLKKLKEIAFDFLLKNLLYKMSCHWKVIQQISIDLMTELVESPDLIVIQTEFSVYHFLKKWLFLKESNLLLYDGINVEEEANDYFRHKCHSAFLLSDNGKKYQRPFLALRKYHLIAHMMDLKVITTDNIMPAEWFLQVFKLQWYQMLQIDEGTDSGPTGVSHEDFYKYSTRCGRVLKYNRETNWRWTGFNYGIDLIINYDKGNISISRGQDFFNVYQADVHAVMEALYKNKKRNIMYRIGVYSMSKKLKVLKKQESGIQTMSLCHRESKLVMSLDSTMSFPVIFSANFLITTPLGPIGQEKEFHLETELNLKLCSNKCDCKRMQNLRRASSP